jgi:hypothetical protein
MTDLLPLINLKPTTPDSSRLRTDVLGTGIEKETDEEEEEKTEEEDVKEEENEEESVEDEDEGRKRMCRRKMRTMREGG